MGSLKESIVPPCIAVPDDYVCFGSIPTFYDREAKHTIPSISEELREIVLYSAKIHGLDVVPRAVAVQTSGPRFETPAEIRVLMGWGDLVGMNMASEATLCSELEIPYVCIASVDNYGNGIKGERPSLELCLERSKSNLDGVVELVKAVCESYLEQ
ncbi:MAG: 5'-methylthioadenosine phosphorylase, partial [Candidatus Thermoplasmatota archaeon]|nr:5'-methylthioadenosine phosphorylase [Candidatus Thermoplasmatota archaeon]